MEKARVPKGEKYWYISLTTGYGENGIDVDWDVDEYGMLDNLKWAEGNYFHTEEEAESMACKLRAVLKGADVIEEWESKEVLDTLHTALNTLYGLTGLDSQREIEEKIAKTPETCLMRMLKKSIEIMSKIVK